MISSLSLLLNVDLEKYIISNEHCICLEQIYQEVILPLNQPSLNEYFDCSACGKNAPLAGSVQYGKHRLCNSCVLLAETGFALKKFDNIQALIDAMEDKRLEELCDFIKKDEAKGNN